MQAEENKVENKKQPRALKPRRSSNRRNAGGLARAQRLSPEERSEIALQAANVRWGRARKISPVEDEALEQGTIEDQQDQEDASEKVALPEARYKGVLRL